MELVEIKNIIKMDNGGTSPIVISNENYLYLIFYKDISQQSNNKYDDKYIMKFDLYLKYNFGIPNNESLYHHPYNKLGIESYSFYELKQSPLLEEMKSIEKQHPYYNENNWLGYKHFIITFHDSMFECIAKDYKLISINDKQRLETMYELLSGNLD